MSQHLGMESRQSLINPISEKICGDEVELALSNKIYCPVTEGLHRCSDAAKSASFYRGGYIYAD